MLEGLQRFGLLYKFYKSIPRNANGTTYTKEMDLSLVNQIVGCIATDAEGGSKFVDSQVQW